MSNHARPLSLLLLAAATVAPAAAETSVTSQPFGETAGGEAVTAYTLRNEAGMTVRLIDYGATVQSLVVPGPDGSEADVVLGFDDVAGYEGKTNPYFGCTVGRYANRIAEGRFELDGETIQLDTNNGDHHLHGGKSAAFSRRVWKGRPVEGSNGAGVEFTLVSPDGDAGYPGEMTVKVRYFVPSQRNSVRISYIATTDAATVVNLTNHSYFNLHGHGGPPIIDHRLMIDADRYTATDEDLIPTGDLPSVEGTPFDFRKAKEIGRDINQTDVGGRQIYDLNFALNGSVESDGESMPKPRLAARVIDRDSGRVMSVRTSEPGVQLYTGDFGEGFDGKNGATYAGRASFCLETQHYPDSPNQAGFPSTVLRPGETFRSVTVYDFTTLKTKGEADTTDDNEAGESP